MNRNKLVLAGVVLLTLFLAIFGRHTEDKKLDQSITSTVLKPAEKEKILVEPQHHRITITTVAGEETLSLPGSRPVAITEDFNGHLTVTTRKWGTEFQPWFGAGFSDNFGASLGFSWFYLSRFDLNAGVTAVIADGVSVRGIIGPSYNVYSNTHLLAAVDTSKHFWVQAFWRF